MLHSRESLAADIRSLGLGPGDRLMVHSSMKSLGRVEGGPTAVIQALTDTLGPLGLLMMPLFNRPKDNLDLSLEPTHLGLIPETFRKHPGVVRSPHPTHSVGLLGARAAEVAETHRSATFIGRGSPLHVLALEKGHVLHIGTDFNSSSVLHVAEVLAGVPYLDVAYRGYNRVLIARATDGSFIRCEPHEVPGDSAMFYLVREEMDRQGRLKHGRVGEADCLLARADYMLEVAVKLLREDPGCFLCHFEDCEVCPPSRELVRSWVEAGKR